MAEMLDAGTEKYFQEKFDNIDEKIDSVISSLDRKERRVESLNTDVIVLKAYMKEHDKLHESMKSTKGYWVLFVFCMITALTNIAIAFIK